MCDRCEELKKRPWNSIVQIGPRRPTDIFHELEFGGGNCGQAIC